MGPREFQLLMIFWQLGLVDTFNVIKLYVNGGSQYLGVVLSSAASFDESNSNKIEILQWTVEKGYKIQTSKEEVLEQVLSGLESVNQSLDTSYKLSKIYFLPSDRASNSVYKLLICKLIRHYHDGKEFQQI